MQTVKTVQKRQKQTLFYQNHIKNNAKMISFCDYKLPAFYQYDDATMLRYKDQNSNIPVKSRGIQFEHHFCRNYCGFFDISHMGRIKIDGQESFKFINFLLPSDIDHLKVNSFKDYNLGQGRYSALLDELGHIIDDVVVYLIKKNSYYLCCNSINLDKVFHWLKSVKNKFFIDNDVTISDLTDKSFQIALQGPKTLKVLKSLLDDEQYSVCFEMNYMDCVSFDLEDQNYFIVARSGYTAEFGFELYYPTNNSDSDHYDKVVDEIFLNVNDLPVLPIGLGARNTLRLEAGFLLHGTDFDQTSNLFLANLSWLISKKDKDYIGKKPTHNYKTLYDKYNNNYQQTKSLASTAFEYNFSFAKLYGFLMVTEKAIVRDNTIAYGFIKECDHNKDYKSLNYHRLIVKDLTLFLPFDLKISENSEILDYFTKEIKKSIDKHRDKVNDDNENNDDNDKKLTFTESINKNCQSSKQDVFVFSEVGVVRSGSFLPTLNRSGGIVSLNLHSNQILDRLCFLSRKKWVFAKLSSYVFYQSKAK